jgi:hypothetical protein
MKECFERREGFCERGLPRTDEAALLSAAAEAGVTDMAMEVESVEGRLGTLAAACARGVALEVSEVIRIPLGCSSNGDGGQDGRFMAGGRGVMYQGYSVSIARGIVDCEQRGRPGR